MLSVSLSLTFSLLMDEKSSGPCDLPPWVLGSFILSSQGLEPSLGPVPPSWACYSFLSTHRWYPLCMLPIHLRTLSTVATALVSWPSCKYVSDFTELYVFFSPTPFPVLPVWILPSFHDLYSNPTFSLQLSLITRARAFFFPPRALKTVRFIWTPPPAALFSDYFRGYSIKTQERYTGQLRRHTCSLHLSFLE